MKIYGISQKLYTPNFRSNMTFDIGGSQREGSCKIYYATTKGDEVIYTKSTTLNDKGVRTFKNSEDFINKIVQKVKKVQEINRETVNEDYNPDENILRSLTILVPSYTVNGHAYYLPNHRDTNNRPLKDLNFSDIKTKLKDAGVEIDPRMQFRLLQDPMGTGLATAKRLWDLGLLEKGKYYTACITGGGCGISNIEMTDNQNIIVKSTGSAVLSDADALRKVSKVGASAPAVIRNFCRVFGFNDELVEDIVSCHKAEFTLQETVKFKEDPNTLRLKKLLLDSGKYELIKEYPATMRDEKEFEIRPKAEFRESYERARRHTIDQYCNAFARLASVKRAEGSNGLIITGPLARQINLTATQVYGKSVSEWVKEKTYANYNQYEIGKMQEHYGFEVFCDDRFFIDDNTACRKLGHIAQHVSPERGNWIKVNVKDVEN